MIRVTRQIVQLVSALALLLRRWPYGRNRAPYLSAGCLVLVLVGAITVIAACYLAAMLIVALLFVKGVIP